MRFIFQLSLGELISGSIFLITAVIVWFYTRAAQRSNEIQEKPILNLYLREAKEGANVQRVLKLRNVGNGPAYNIRISDIEAGGYKYAFGFDEPNFILEREKDERKIDFHVTTPDGGMEIFEDKLGFENFITRLFPKNTSPDDYGEHKRAAAIFSINYSGINKKSYHSIFRLYPTTWPLFSVYKLVVEFVDSGDGKCDLEKARTICESREILS